MACTGVVIASPRTVKRLRGVRVVDVALDQQRVGAGGERRRIHALRCIVRVGHQAAGAVQQAQRHVGPAGGRQMQPLARRWRDA